MPSSQKKYLQQCAGIGDRNGDGKTIFADMAHNLF